ncbi:MAG TPA: hypothetical protein VEY06_04970 [Flavisolibacter sp.]|nr:hypothetical protein [Flavisolibacter sp.]
MAVQWFKGRGVMLLYNDLPDLKPQAVKAAQGLRFSPKQKYNDAGSKVGPVPAKH